jgi:hypothetical protein
MQRLGEQRQYFLALYYWNIEERGFNQFGTDLPGYD